MGDVGLLLILCPLGNMPRHSSAAAARGKKTSAVETRHLETGTSKQGKKFWSLGGGNKTRKRKDNRFGRADGARHTHAPRQQKPARVRAYGWGWRGWGFFVCIFLCPSVKSSVGCTENTKEVGLGAARQRRSGFVLYERLSKKPCTWGRGRGTGDWGGGGGKRGWRR